MLRQEIYHILNERVTMEFICYSNCVKMLTPFDSSMHKTADYSWWKIAIFSHQSEFNSLAKSSRGNFTTMFSVKSRW